MIRLGLVALSAFLIAACGGGPGGGSACGDYPPANTSEYSFPFDNGKEVYVSQGNCSSPTHFGISRYAYDFAVPVGTAIIASRAGQVVGLEESLKDGTGTSEGNYVYIEHDDGTIAAYMHLTKNGVVVKMGQSVQAGDRIAVSGNTGNSTGPHLHFVVWRNNLKTQSIPITFNDLEDTSAQALREGQYHKSVAR